MPRPSLRRSCTTLTPRPLVGTVEPLERRLCLSTATFLPPAHFAPGVAATSVATGEFDSGADVVLAGGGGIYFLSGDGDGTLKPPVKISGETGATSLLVEDFNADGNLDLAFADPAGGRVGVLLGNGDGTFAAATHLPAVAGAGTLTFGDFNGDYNDDLLVAGPGGLAFLPGNGDGTFGAARTIRAGSYQGATVGDFNDDGFDDVAATTAGLVQVFIGNGDGTFSAPATYDAGEGASTVVTGDFNGDNTDDLAVATPGGNAVAVLFGQTNADDEATGSFGAPVRVALGATFPPPSPSGTSGATITTTSSSAPRGKSWSRLATATAPFPSPRPTAARTRPRWRPTTSTTTATWTSSPPTRPAARPFSSRASRTSASPSAPPASVAINGTLTYTLTVHNTSSVDSSGVSLYDCFPTDADLVSATASQGSVDTSGDGQLDAELGDLPAGASATVTLVIRPKAYGVASNFASVSTESGDGDWSNNYAEADTRVVGASGAELGITQTATGGGVPIYWEGGADRRHRWRGERARPGPRPLRGRGVGRCRDGQRGRAARLVRAGRGHVGHVGRVRWSAPGPSPAGASRRFRPSRPSSRSSPSTRVSRSSPSSRSTPSRSTPSRRSGGAGSSRSAITSPTR